MFNVPFDTFPNQSPDRCKNLV